MITSDTSSTTLNGNGVTTAFPFTFKVFNVAQLQAWILAADGTSTQITDFTAVLAGDGGTVTYPAVGTTKLPTGAKITILRAMEFTQETNLVNGESFRAEVVEDMEDTRCMEALELKEQLIRAVKVPVGSSTLPDDLLAELADDVATATTQAGLATTAKNAAVVAQGLAEAAQGAAEAARDAIPAAADILVDSDIGVTVQGYDSTTLKSAAIGVTVQAYDADTLIADVSKVRTKSHPSTKSAVTDNSLTPDLTTAETFDWTPTGAATLNAPTIVGAGVWAIRYNYTSGPTLPKATYDGSAWVATGDILLLIGFGSADYELIWLNKA